MRIMHERVGLQRPSKGLDNPDFLSRLAFGRARAIFSYAILVSTARQYRGSAGDSGVPASREAALAASLGSYAEGLIVSYHRHALKA